MVGFDELFFAKHGFIFRRDPHTVVSLRDAYPTTIPQAQETCPMLWRLVSNIFFCCENQGPIWQFSLHRLDLVNALKIPQLCIYQVDSLDGG